MIESGSDLAVALVFNSWLSGAVLWLVVLTTLRIGRGLSVNARCPIAFSGFGLAVVLPIALAYMPAVSEHALATSGRAAIGRLGSVLVPIWAAGASLLLLREAAGHLHLRRLRRRSVALRRDVAASLGADGAVLLTGDEGSAQAFGCWQPVIYVPRAMFASLSAQTLAFVIRHEAAHVRRRDPLVRAGVRWLRACCWISWPAWALARVIFDECEARADVAVLEAASSPAHARDYARALLAVAAWQHHARSTVAVRASSGLERRVRRLLAGTPPSRRPLPAALVFAGGLAVLAFLPRISVPTPAAVAGSTQAQARLAPQTIERTVMHEFTRTRTVERTVVR
jgi:beta-lactamase regulating signal transducer with metallopeptidase domain